MEKETKEEITKLLLSQLHEQFAKNDNDKSQKVISFINSLAFVLTGFGFAYWYYDESKSCILNLITFASCIVLLLLSFLCVSCGYSIRRDQIIIYRIRQFVMGDDYTKIFGDLYKPSNKCPMGYLVSYYNIVFAFVNIILICICFATGLKQCPCFWISICIIFLSINCFYYLCKYCKYKEIDINMNQKEDDNNNNINNKQNHETN